MPDGFKVTGEQLHKGSVDTAQVRENAAGHINHMRSQIASIEGAWKGEAATAFHSLFQRFTTASDKILNELQVISESLDTAAKKYGHNEVNAVQSLKTAGGGGDFSF